jgi:hypothetical protein
MRTHGGYYTVPPPLTYHEAIYWETPAIYSEWSISPEVLYPPDIAYSVRACVTENLRIVAAEEMAKQCPNWLHYTTVVSECERDYMIIVRHTLYEQPGYHEIKLFRAPPEQTTYRKMDDQHNVVDLFLRRLMYYGAQVRGALHDGTLYVVF